MKNIYLLIIVLAVLLKSQAVFAVEFDVAVGAGLEHTDNALRSADSPQSELEARLNADLGLEYEGPKLNISLGYEAERIEYDKGTQNDTTNVTGDGSVVYEQIARKLYWSLENSRRNSIVDRGAADIESNREDRSITNAGVELILRPSGVDRLSSQLFYNDIKYENSDDLDSDRAGAQLSWIRNLTRVDTLALHLTYQEASYEANVDDTDYQMATLEYGVELARLSYSVEAGYNESRRDSGDNSGGYFSANVLYDNNVISYSIRVLQELTDTSSGNNNDSIIGGGDFNSNSEDVNIFERLSAALEYTSLNLCPQCTFEASLSYEEEDYDENVLDVEEYNLSVFLGYNLTRLLTLGVNAAYQELFFELGSGSEDYNNIFYGLDLTQRITEEFSVNYFLTFEDRDYDGLGADYDDLRGGVTVEYQF